ncbi:DUF4125 family protein [Oleidesulfovibrio sp.]|uniref:DUF4125 family protein n=1 Tax=Oleidesulfovibrio sp. TaxID=2909707 RepID=UPI003A8B93CE
MQPTQELIERIMSLELSMFQNVHGSDGRASCQNDPETFRIMRKSQFITWTAQILESYYKDLQTAEHDKRNLLSEKYAFMMESTHPKEFAGIRHMLPVLPAHFCVLRENIATNYMFWEQELTKNYPHLKAQGRPSFSKQDIFGITSVETYLRGELSTYSLTTLQKLLEYTNACRKKGRNLAEETLAETMVHYGFASIQEGEAWAAANAKK